ncbi:MAG: hypothetical protein K2N79_06545 [Muribaculaceae bacterium]|nr:hypothetical protein [Muribaculaceae bacterium]MDE7368855.1 hypothetical protein [Muribaculaceae bacterium]
MMKISKYILSLLVGGSVAMLSSCNDSINHDTDLAEGEGNLTVTVFFQTEETNLGKSRTNGDVIKNINNVTYLFYSEETQALVNAVYFNCDSLRATVPAQRPSDYPVNPPSTDGTPTSSAAEWSVDHVTNTFRVPYGQYYIYAVANMGENFTANTDIQTVEGLKALRVNWDSDNIANNNQMFGYLTNANTGLAATAPLTYIDADHLQITGWLKRLVSKVSVAYDGSKLNDGVTIYIHNVSVRQIPLSCSLGNPNKPDATDQVSPAYFQQSIPLADAGNQAIFYNTNGITNVISDYNTANYESWLAISNKNEKILGLSQPGGFPSFPSEEFDNEQALFFFENMQGDFTPKTGALESGDESKSKVQDPEKVGTAVGVDDEDYLDGVPYGTFVEVEAYYVNGTKQGPIRYRFMLGQDVKYNYNATRNHYYKLTFCFNGTADNVDWHIDYTGS